MAPTGWNAVAASPGHTALATNDGRWHWLMVNCADSLLGDVGVRRAIATAIDRRALAAPFGPHAHPLTGGVVAAWSWAHGPDLGAFPPEGDPAAARALLDEAGIAPGTGIEIVELDTVPSIRRHAPLIAAQLREIGLAAEAREMTVAHWGGHVTRGGPFQLATSYWGSPINDPDDFLYMGVRSGARYDLGTCGSEEIDQLLDAGRGSIDQRARAETYRALQAEVVARLPVIATIQPDVLRGMSRRLRGFAPLRNAQIRSLREAWLA
jgi:peptide/nickel transport system substrate-binding protein